MSLCRALESVLSRTSPGSLRLLPPSKGESESPATLSGSDYGRFLWAVTRSSLRLCPSLLPPQRTPREDLAHLADSAIPFRLTR
jgi:hypothetical protein